MHFVPPNSYVIDDERRMHAVVHAEREAVERRIVDHQSIVRAYPDVRPGYLAMV